MNSWLAHWLTMKTIDAYCAKAPPMPSLTWIDGEHTDHQTAAENMNEALETANLPLLNFLLVERRLNVNAFYQEKDWKNLSMTPLALCIRFAAHPSLKRLHCFLLLLSHGARPYDNASTDTRYPEYENCWAVWFKTFYVGANHPSYFQQEQEAQDCYLIMLASMLSHLNGHVESLNERSVEEEETPLESAVQWGASNATASFLSIQTVTMLLEAGALPNAGKMGTLCLTLRNHEDTATCLRLCQLLLDAGADINEHPKFLDEVTDERCEDTPLVAACARKGPDAVVLTHMLLDVKGMNPNICVGQRHKLSCLSLAADHPTHSKTLIKLLLLYGADPHHRARGHSILWHMPPATKNKFYAAWLHEPPTMMALSMRALRQRETTVFNK